MSIDPLIAVAAIGALSSIVVSILNRRKIDNLHTLINSNLTRQIEASIAEALGRGIAIGVEQERSRPKPKE